MTRRIEISDLYGCLRSLPHRIHFGRVASLDRAHSVAISARRSSRLQLFVGGMSVARILPNTSTMSTSRSWGGRVNSRNSTFVARKTGHSDIRRRYVASRSRDTRRKSDSAVTRSFTFGGGLRKGDRPHVPGDIPERSPKSRTLDCTAEWG